MLLLCGGFVLLIFVPGISSNERRNDSSKYVIVTDAETRYTKMTLYATQDDDRVVLPVSECDVTKASGIRQFVDYPQDVGKVFTRCFRAMEQALMERDDFKVTAGAHNFSSVKLYFGATEDMRAINHSDPTKAENLVREVGNAINSSRFSLPAKDGARILDDVDQTFYEWVAVNQVRGNFETDHNWTGTLRLDGKVAAIAFPCEDDDHLSEDDVSACRRYDDRYVRRMKTSTVNGETQDVSTVSRTLNCFGTQEALRKAAITMMFNQYSKTQSIISELTNPCLPSGWQQESSATSPGPLDRFYTRPQDVFEINECNTHFPDEGFMTAVQKVLKSPDFEFDYKAVNNEAYDVADECRQFVSKILDPETCKQTFLPEACIDDDSLPDTGEQISNPKIWREVECMEYVASSPHWQTFVRLLAPGGSADDDVTMSFEMAEESRRKICTTRTTGSVGAEGETDCFVATYLLQLLTQGYGFRMNLTHHNFSLIRFSDKIDGKDLGWPLGFASTKLLHHESGAAKLSHSLSLLLVVNWAGILLTR